MIGVVTNAGLIAFTMTTLDDAGFTAVAKLWIFIGFQVHRISLIVILSLSLVFNSLNSFLDYFSLFVVGPFFYPHLYQRFVTR